jgi:hypothetical protein
LQVFQFGSGLLPLGYDLLQSGAFFQQILGSVSLIPKAWSSDLCL